MAGAITRPIAAALLAGAIAALALAGCGGGSDGPTSKAEFATQVEAACTKLSGYTIWLPEHLSKTGKSVDEGEAIVDEAAAEFRATLDSLDPPDELRAPLEALTRKQPPVRTIADVTAGLERQQELYERIGAETCAKASRAAILSIRGASVVAAHRKLGIPLPPKPEGW